jgi:hypothetical protein
MAAARSLRGLPVILPAFPHFPTMDRKEIAVLSVGKDDAAEEQSSSLSGWG